MFGFDRPTVAVAEKALADHLAKEYKPEHAYDWALGRAQLEGALEVVRAVEEVRGHCERKGWSAERTAFAMMDTLVRQLEQGPRDTWSGRGNDQRRARHDGKCEAARDLRYFITRDFDDSVDA